MVAPRTLTLEVFKRLRKLEADKPLDEPLKDREDVGKISIIKDLSERDKTRDRELVTELSAGEKRFLLVSNTGTLLNLVKKHPELFGSDPVTLENKVLEAIGSVGGSARMQIGSMCFQVYNLALMNNLPLARRVFEKMLAPERWGECGERACAASCPIHRNVRLIQRNQKRVLDRLFLAYRRMYEYGVRLTMRQFTEHLAYLITSGLNEADIRKLRHQNPPPLVAEHLFFNRFFGDNGFEADPAASEMKGVRMVSEQCFGERPCPGWEHRLWLRSGVKTFALEVEGLKEEFEKLRQHGSGERAVSGMTPEQAREQVRRMVYFFAEEDSTYLTQYLNSPSLLKWRDWQKPGAELDFHDRASLDQRVYHVLQEHFTGVRMPEGSRNQGERRLYVTLSRRRSEVRQSAQVVLAQLDWPSSTRLELRVEKTAMGDSRSDLILAGKERISGLELVLRVPFLDYVLMRHFGEIGEVLEAAYLERLEKFKAQVHEKAAAGQDDRIMLVRLRTDHTFRRQEYKVTHTGLEVNDGN